MNHKVLILGVASVQMDAILELKKLGYETYACAMDNDGPGADVADHFEKINILDIDSLISYIKKNKITAVYSVGSDLAMPVANKISEQLKMPHFVSAETAEICNNKDLMRSTLGNDFIGNVNFQVVKNKNDKIGIDYPYIMKPADSQGQRGIILVHNYEEYLENYDNVQRYSRSGTVILEQYISGPELSVNGYVVDGEIKYMMPSDRETWPQYTGLIRKHIVPTTKLAATKDRELYDIIQNACNKLGINNGPVYAQVKLEEDKPYIIEITPRLDGCHMWNLIEHYSDFNLLKLTLERLLKEDITELENLKVLKKDSCTLEFICQKPNTEADYSQYDNALPKSIESFKYYNQGENIRPVNGKHEKIGYFIY